MEKYELSDNAIPPLPPDATQESTLDSLVSSLENPRGIDAQATTGASAQTDKIQKLREMMMTEFIGEFVALMEKYSSYGITMEMDVSNFLEGGREIRFEFGLGEYRANLMGTVTTEAIAFHETRHTPDIRGDLVSAPMLRLHNLNKKTFREFICERLTVLARAAKSRK